MSKEGKHHYIPVFYLKQWRSGNDRKLCEFTRPRALISTKRVGPRGTGFVHGLYSIPGLPAEQAQYIEKKYMQKLDNKAATALRAMLKQSPGQISLSEELKISWAAFLYSLILRSPEIIAAMAIELERQRAIFRSMSTDTASAVVDGVRHTVTVKHRPLHAQEFLPGFIAGQVVRELVAMRWQTISTASADHPMLTSDRPVIMTNGFAHAEGHVGIPISPTMLFLATRPEGTYQTINAMSAEQLVISVNHNVAQHAIDYVYGVDAREWIFVSMRLGMRVQSTPIG
jgi:hypothetical protein